MEPKYTLRLYVAGGAPKSAEAIANLQRIRATHLADSSEIEIIDVFEQPQLALSQRIVLTPTLVLLSRSCEARIVGTLSDERPVLAALGL